MGYSTGLGLANTVREGLDLELAVSTHLEFNCFPSLGMFCDVAVRVIELHLIGLPGKVVALPDGVLFRDGRSAVEARELVRPLFLGAFLEVLLDEGWDDVESA